MEPLTTEFWLNEAALLHGIVYEIVEEAAEKGVIAAVNGVIQALLNVREPDVDYGLLNEAAHALAQQHAFDLVSGVTDTSRRALQRELTEWIASGEPLPALTDKLTAMFGPVRAEAIAVTEVTRVYHRSNVAAWREFGVDAWTFQTAVDEIVCPMCAPLHGQEFQLDDEEHAPPIHTRCRCYSKPLIRLPGEPQPQTQADGWPVDPDGLEPVRSLGGSTGAELVRDSATGKQYVRKRGASPEHVRREVLADDTYRALGQRVPAARLYETPGGPVKLAEFIEGEQFGDLWKKGQIKPETLRELQDGFAADVLTGNRDVLGLDFDNILVDRDGHPWRIDNGGSFDFRAQGGPKAFDEWPMELWTLRDAAFNRQGFDVYGPMKYADVMESARSMGGRFDMASSLMPDELRPAFEARWARMQQAVGQFDELTGDGWKPAYPDRFTYFGFKMEQDGLLDKLPRRLSNAGVQVYDENGTPFDSLRGGRSIMNDVEKFINGNGGDYGMVRHYMSNQAGSSWSTSSQALKHYISEAMNVDDSKVFWTDREMARRAFQDTVDRFGVDTYKNTWQSFHAFNYNMLKRTEFLGNDQATGIVRLIRTEPKGVLRAHKVKQGKPDQWMPRGLAESSSIFQPVRIAGTEVTIQQVPHSRVLGMYFYNRDPGSTYGAFLGDNENEFVFIPYGLKFEWKK